ncbi:YlbF family regulator [Sporolactobacillus sp. THM19-2]|nr:YlbF family regulator [Sporolactobacillus sp. THM19-2]
MMVTMESVSLLDEAEQLADMLTHSELYEKYMICRNHVAASSSAQQVIRKFKIIREKYNEVQRFGRYHPDFKKVIRQMMDVKREVDLHPVIADYKHAEKELDDLLGQVSLELARSVSKSVKVPTGDPFFDRACNAGCGAGGKCKCRTTRSA